MRDWFAGAEVLEQRETAPDAAGRFTRFKLLKTDFKYPLVRVEEAVEPGPGAGRVVKRTAMVADHVLVRVRAGVTEAELSELAARHGGVIRQKRQAPDTYLVAFERPAADTVPTAVKALTSEAARVAYAEPDYIVHSLARLPDDPLFSQQWGFRNTGQSGGTPGADIDATLAWDSCTGSTNVLVAVIDTGVDYSHADLLTNIWYNAGEAGPLASNLLDDDSNGYVNDYLGWDFYNNDNNPFDDHGHGTHCAGGVGAAGNSGAGVAGVCWRVSLLAVKFLGASGTGTESDAIDAVYYAVRRGAKVLSNSYGGGASSQAERDAVEYANTNGVLYVAAAGNDGLSNDVYPHYPSSYTNANVISVAASTRFDTLASFSNYGAVSVDLAAPGEDILSTSPGGLYQLMSGTSMATPLVAGAAALLWSEDPGLPVAEVKALLLDNVDTSAAYAGKTLTGGRLNVFKALRNIWRLRFDSDSYFLGSWVTVTLRDFALVGTTEQTVHVVTSGGDAEELQLTQVAAGSPLFTNRIWLAASAPVLGNGQLEASEGAALTAISQDASSGSSNVASAVVSHALSLTLTPPPSLVPYETNALAVTGFANGNVRVDLVVSNAANGACAAFVATNAWASPAVPLAVGPNTLWVTGVNAYGYADSEFVTVIRRGPPGVTNHVAQAGTHQWPFLTWETAATNIHDALIAASASNVILLTSGTYHLRGENLQLDRALTVKGQCGASNTVVVAGPSARAFTLTHAGARLEGLTITGGNAESGGAVLCASGGTVMSCLIVSNAAAYGGGIACFLQGLVSNCEIRANTASEGGGGVYLSAGGLAQNCVITDNAANQGGGAYEWSGGTLRNCLVAKNSAADKGGGVYFYDDGLVQSCTLATNAAAGRGGGVYCYAGGTVQNTAVYHNRAPIGPNREIYNAGYSFLNCSVIPSVGTACVTNDPQFADAAAGDFRLLPGSACINAGTNQSWMAGAVDLDGRVRLYGARTDIGAYEFDPAAGALRCTLVGAPLSGIEPLAVAFTGSVFGAITDSVRYAWDFDGDGTAETNGLGLAAVTHTYFGAGAKSVTLTVSNAAGEVACYAKTDYVQVQPVPLTIISPHGALSPPRGMNGFAYGSAVTCTVTDSPVPSGVSTQYVCTGWRGTGSAPAAGAGTNVTFTLTGASTLAWAWRTQFMFTVSSAAYGSVEAAGGWYDRGSNVTALAVADAGHHFVSWGGDVAATAQTNNPLTLAMTQARRVTAFFESDTNQYALAVSSAYGSPQPPLGTNRITYGSAVVCLVPDSPAGGGAGTRYACTGWSGTGCVPASGADTSVSVTLTQDSWIGWNWKTQVQCTASAGPNGSVAPADAWRDLGASLSVTSAPAAGYRFAGWSGDVPANLATNNPLTLVMDRPRAVQASFVANVTYVAPEGSHIYPFADWATAATNLQAAVDAAGDGGLVLVTNGTYALPATLSIAKGVAVRSVGGAAVTVLDGGYPARTNRCLYLSHADAVVEGFTLTRGRPAGNVGGGGAYLNAGGLVQNCVLVSNVAFQGGGVYLYYGGAARNCLVAGNTATSRGGGLYCNTGGDVQNCTVSANAATVGGGGVYCNYGGALQNTILYGNTSPSGLNFSDYNNAASGMTYLNCCTFPARGTACVTNEPQFASAAAGDFRLLPGSPCEGAGTNQSWMGDAKDLDGNARLIGARADIGAYELAPAAGALRCNLLGAPLSGVEPLAVSFNSHIAGADTDPAWYAWDFDGDGSAETNGMGLAAPIYTYFGAGSKTVSLTVSNAAGEVACYARADYVQVLPVPLMVSSVHGALAPPRGTNGFAYGSSVTCAVLDSPVPLGVATQYCCIGWRGTGSAPAAGAGSNVTFTLTSLSSLTWTWKTQFLFAASAAANGSVAADVGWYDRGSNVTAWAVADAGHHFVAWGGDVAATAQTNNPLTLAMSQARRVTAYFEPDTNQYALVVASAYGSPEPPRGTNRITYGSAVVCAVPDSPAGGGAGTRYACTGWSGTGSVPASGTGASVGVTLTQDSWLGWNWKTQVQCTASAGPNGSVAPADAWRDLGATLSVTSTPAAGYRFAGWAGDVPANLATNNPLTLVMDRPRAVTVQFVTNMTYVAPEGSHVYPFVDWATAATNLQAAVDAAGDGGLVLVADGTYALPATLSIAKGVTVRSVGGPAVTVLDGGYPARTNRCLYLSHADAVVEGFTLTRGRPVGNVGGGGAYLNGGGLVQNCVLVSNVAFQGGGLYLHYGGTARNCLVAGNLATSRGGGLYCNNLGGQVQNCTVVANSATNNGGGVYCNFGGALQNTVLYGNASPSGANFTDYNNAASGMTYLNCCTFPLRGTACVTNDPQFANAAAGDFRLLPGSPCEGAGTNQSWMAGSKDLDGNERLIGARADIGAYEFAAGARTLTVVSPHGAPTPARGAHANLFGAALSCGVASPETLGATQYVCVGASVVGNGFTLVSPTSLTLTLTNDATLTWLWRTNYWLDVAGSGQGSVAPGSGWFAKDAAASLSAVPSNYWHFAHWTGDVSSAANPLSLTVGRPASLLALFAENLATNGTPEWWLAGYGLTNGWDAEALDDRDRDGLAAWQERLAGTDPTNAASVLSFVAIAPAASSDGVMLRWQSVSGKRYRIERGTNLADNPAFGYLVQTNILGVAPMNTETDRTAVGSGPWFYRIMLEQ